MKLEVRLFAGLKCNNQVLPCFGKNEFILEVPNGITVGELNSIMKLESKYPLINMINGVSQKGGYVISEGARVGIFPPVGGG